VERPLVGGFAIAQQVQSAMDLVIGTRVVVKVGTRGSVLAEFSDTRLTVAFDASEDGGQSCFNVLPLEIKPWCEPPRNFPVGASVQVTEDLVNMSSVVIRAGTVGVVLGGVDETQVFISFAGSGNESQEGEAQTLTVGINLLRRLPAQEGEGSDLAELRSSPALPREDGREAREVDAPRLDPPPLQMPPQPLLSSAD